MIAHSVRKFPHETHIKSVRVTRSSATLTFLRLLISHLSVTEPPLRALVRRRSPRRDNRTRHVDPRMRLRFPHARAIEHHDHARLERMANVHVLLAANGTQFFPSCRIDVL